MKRTVKFPDPRRSALDKLILLVSLELVASFWLVGCAAGQGMPAPASPRPAELLLATTTSTQDTGLLDMLLPLFEQRTGYGVKTVAVGTGAALALGARGEADVVLVHAPEAEKSWLAQGNGTERLLVMHNDFILVGPDEDPARISRSSSVVAAIGKIADVRATFVSRGDSSGTHQLEQRLWREASLAPKGAPWYIESGSGMSQTLSIAAHQRSYTLTDRGTWLTRRSQLGLPIMVEGDPLLLNLYHVMPVNPAKFPPGQINAAGGRALAEFLVSPEAQQLIAEFGREKFGQPLFTPDAGKPDPGKKEEQVGRT